MKRPLLRYCKLAAIFARSGGWRYELAITQVPSNGPGYRAATQVRTLQHSRRKRSPVMWWSEIQSDEKFCVATSSTPWRSFVYVLGLTGSSRRSPVGGL